MIKITQRNIELDQPSITIYIKSLLIIWICIFNNINLIYGSEIIPPNVDASRIGSKEDPVDPESFSPQPSIVPKSTKPKPSTEDPKALQFILKKIDIEGNTAFTDDVIEKFFIPYLNKKINLATAYKLTEQITNMYKKSDYFMSLATIPQQTISAHSGILKIKIIEGHIRSIEFPKDLTKYQHKMDPYVKILLTEHPLKAHTLENVLLTLNDLFGTKIKGVISTDPTFQDGEIKLSLIATPEPSNTMLNFNNYMSRLIGPHELGISKGFTFSPFQRSFISAACNPADPKKLNHVGLNHEIKLDQKNSLEFNGNINNTAPEPILGNNIKSQAKLINFGVTHQIIKQRQYSLKIKGSLNLKDTNNYIMKILSSTDRIRTIKANIYYEFYDQQLNFHTIDATLTKGFNLLGSSKYNQLKKSRELATPNFSKIEFHYNHWRNLTRGFSALFSILGQYAKDPLYAAEEFGYGGQNLGRAFDNSEITGDHGIGGSIELAYHLLPEGKNTRSIPYVYYDIGMVWRKDPNRNHKAKGSTIGLGFKNQICQNLNTNISFNWPLMRKISNPIYGGSINDPRIAIKISLLI